MARKGSSKIVRKNRGTRRADILRRAGKAASRFSVWIKRGTVILGTIVFLGWCGAWFFLSEADTYMVHWARKEALALSVRVGFTVKDILVEGRRNTDVDLLLSLINVREGDPLFSVSPPDAKALIEQISWVKRAQVERRLPDTIYIHLIERTPLALWQQGERLSVIDSEGVVLTDRRIKPFADLPLLRGEHAPEHAQDFLSILNAEGMIRERFDQAYRVDNRRWDIRLSDGKLVKLPEKDAGLALRRLADRHERDGVLDKDIVSIDLRDPARFIVRTAPGKAVDYNKVNTSAGATSL